MRELLTYFFYATLLAYAAFVVLIGWSAFRTSNAGWRSGVLLTLLLASIPLWVMGMCWVYCFLSGQKMGFSGGD